MLLPRYERTKLRLSNGASMPMVELGSGGTPAITSRSWISQGSARSSSSAIRPVARSGSRPPLGAPISCGRWSWHPLHIGWTVC